MNLLNNGLAGSSNFFTTQFLQLQTEPRECLIVYWALDVDPAPEEIDHDPILARCAYGALDHLAGLQLVRDIEELYFIYKSSALANSPPLMPTRR